MEKELFSIDRFEGNFAVCISLSTNNILNVDKAIIPQNAKEGDIIFFNGDVYEIDSKKTSETQAEIKTMVDNLFNN